MKKSLALALFIIITVCLSAQSLTSIYPTSGNQGDVAKSEQIDAYGVNFSHGINYNITIHLGTWSITGYNVQVVSSGRLTVSFDIPLNFPEGTYYLTLVGGADSFTTINPVYIVYAPATSGFANIEMGAIKAYPIPAHDMLYVNIPAGSATQTVAIISLSAQTMLSKAATGNAEEYINLQHIAAGAYILQVTGSNGAILRRKILVN